MLNFVLWLFWVIFGLHTDKNIAVLSQLVFFCPHTDKHLAVLSKLPFDTQSIHIFGLVYYLSTCVLPGIVHFISGVTHMENDLLFCSNSREASDAGEFHLKTVTWLSRHFLWKMTFNPSVKIRQFTINTYAWNQLKYTEYVYG